MCVADIICYSENEYMSIKDEMCKLSSICFHGRYEKSEINIFDPDLDLNFLSGYPEITNFINGNKNYSKLAVSKILNETDKGAFFNLFIFNDKEIKLNNCKYLGISLKLKKDKRGSFTKAAIKK